MGGKKCRYGEKDVSFHDQRRTSSKNTTSLQRGVQDSTTAKSETPTTNKPRNLLIANAVRPFVWTYTGRFQQQTTITIDQTPDEETWPGGALWDSGLLVAHTLVAAANSSLPCVWCDGKRIIPRQPERLVQAVRKGTLVLEKRKVVLELGCGVGFSGLVAAVALQPDYTILTDLKVVVDKVAKPNLEKNSKPIKGGQAMWRTVPGGGKVAAMPLCWGDQSDEEQVWTLLRSIPSTTPTRRPRKKKQASVERDEIPSLGFPNVILIGDVAYQHKPGAPSHFEALVATLMNLCDQHTVVIFGTRIRMPASVDLLLMMLEHFDEIIQPIDGHEVDDRLKDIKHNMTVHFLRRKPSTDCKT